MDALPSYGAVFIPVFRNVSHEATVTATNGTHQRQFIRWPGSNIPSLISTPRNRMYDQQQLRLRESQIARTPAVVLERIEDCLKQPQPEAEDLNFCASIKQCNSSCNVERHRTRLSAKPGDRRLHAFLVTSTSVENAAKTNRPGFQFRCPAVTRSASRVELLFRTHKQPSTGYLEDYPALGRAIAQNTVHRQHTVLDRPQCLPIPKTVKKTRAEAVKKTRAEAVELLIRRASQGRK